MPREEKQRSSCGSTAGGSGRTMDGAAMIQHGAPWFRALSCCRCCDCADARHSSPHVHARGRRSGRCRGLRSHTSSSFSPRFTRRGAGEAARRLPAGGVTGGAAGAWWLQSLAGWKPIANHGQLCFCFDLGHASMGTWRKKGLC